MAFINWRRVRLFMVRVIANCVISVWKLLAQFGKINIVKDKVLYPRVGANTSLNSKLSTLTKNFGHECLERMSRVLDKYGDFECMINGYFHLYGQTRTCGQKSQTLSGFIQDSRRLGTCLYNKAGL